MDNSFHIVDIPRMEAPHPFAPIEIQPSIKLARSITNFKRSPFAQAKLDDRYGKSVLETIRTKDSQSHSEESKIRAPPSDISKLAGGGQHIKDPSNKVPKESVAPAKGQRLGSASLEQAKQTRQFITFPRPRLPWLDGKSPSVNSSDSGALFGRMPGGFDSDGSLSPSTKSSRKTSTAPDQDQSHANTVQNALQRSATMPRAVKQNSENEAQYSSSNESPLSPPKHGRRRVSAPPPPALSPGGSEPLSSSTGSNDSANLLPVHIDARQRQSIPTPELFQISDRTDTLQKHDTRRSSKLSGEPRRTSRQSQLANVTFEMEEDPRDRERNTVYSAQSSDWSPRTEAKGTEKPASAASKARKHQRASQASMNQAITDMEGLVEEAIQVANDAAESHQPGIAATVLEQTDDIMRKASDISDRQHLTVMEPLPISDISESTSASSSASSISVAVSDEEVGLASHIVVNESSTNNSEGARGVPHPSDLQLSGKDKHPEPEAIDWAYVLKGDGTRERSFRRTRDSGRHSMYAHDQGRSQVSSPQIRKRKGISSPMSSREDILKRTKQHTAPTVSPRHSSLRFNQSQSAGSAGHPTVRRADAEDDAEVYSQRNNTYTATGERDGGTRPATLEKLDSSMSGVSLKRTPHWSFRSKNGSGLSLRRYRHKPVARNWRTSRKRISATIACINTAFVGYIIGVYAGEVPRIQYQLADEQHVTILGNVVLYIGLAISTIIFWPLPLLHGRKPYTLAALAITLPLQFPQAISIASPRSPDTPTFRVGLLLSRALSGFALGFANINFLTTLLDLFGASLQSQKPHQELLITNDPRRHGGGMGLWLGIWTWCFLGSLALGFLTGAGIIADLNPAWGFYIVVIILAFVLLLNVMIPETRRAMYRQSVAEFRDEQDRPNRVVARGEVKLHISADGPKYWYEEVLAGLKLSCWMLSQFGFAVLAIYWAWIYAQIVLVIVLLGALLSREYRFHPQYVGCGVFSIAIGALLAVPLAKASFLSRARTRGPRTDSMTLQARVTWTSHLVRRVIFTTVLPFMGLAYTLASPGKSVHFVLPCFFAATIGFLSNLAIAECLGLIMETFDTSDLQPGVNSRHRLQSMASTTRRRRTNYSSFPRVTAGVFVAQALAFLFAAAATGAGGVLTRGLGAQAATGLVAGILLFLTLMLTAVLWRFREVQVIPKHAFGTRKNSAESFVTKDESWKPVIIGNPSGKMRRMNLLEMGDLSRWTEIRRLNKLIKS